MRDRIANLGLLALVVAAGGLVSGVFLALNYAPTLDAARRSVAYIQEDVALGAFLRALHHWAGTFAIVLAGLHGWRLFWNGSYKAPRRTLWWLGCGIFLVLLGFAYTGYLLAGDERAVTGLGVMAGVAGSTPVVGDAVRSVLIGGDAVSSATLSRIYVVHVVLLPAALVILVLAFVRHWRRPDAAPLHGEAAAAIVVLALLGLAAALFPPGLGAEPDPAGAGAAEGRPEWFFLWVNELLHRIPGATFLVAGLLPGALVGLAFALPLIARKSERDPARRKPEIAVAVSILACIGVLTVLAAARPTDAGEPEPPAAVTAGSADEAALAVIGKFRCSKCHTIDGDEEGGETGPPLDRREFPGLYTRRLFRKKVGDPLAFWPDTGMVYKPRSRKPTEDELDILERHFFGG